ncbi:MAG: LptF/LptG family permease [Planctomycetes bacterium]|nr:LptF/LptG family permease [Planctomycetota bacterium]
MFSIIDRYVLKALLANYLIGLGVMMSLYVTLDMFVNMDEFTEQGYPIATVVANIASYYWPNLFNYFAQLSGAITLFACMAVIARMRRLNELTAILSSGVSLYHLARPIIGFGVATTALLVIDTEWVIPSVAHLLARDHDDADGKRAYEVLFLHDRDNALLCAGAFDPTTRDLHRLLVLKRGEHGAVTETWEADRAVWEPPGELRESGRWRLERGKRIVRVHHDGATLGPRDSVHETYPQFYESDLSPEAIQLRQAEGWIRYLSLSELRRQEEGGTASRTTVMQARHTRITAPIISMVLLFLGLPFFLDRSPVDVLGDTGKCLIACGLCYVTNFVAQNLRTETESALAAWIPIFVFATLAAVLIDRIRT